MQIALPEYNPAFCIEEGNLWRVSKAIGFHAKRDPKQIGQHPGGFFRSAQKSPAIGEIFYPAKSMQDPL